MKRWQRLGRVDDSEEDDPGSTSQPSEPSSPRLKRQKSAHVADRAESHSAIRKSVELDEGEFAHPAVSTSPAQARHGPKNSVPTLISSLHERQKEDAASSSSRSKSGSLKDNSQSRDARPALHVLIPSVSQAGGRLPGDDIDSGSSLTSDLSSALSDVDLPSILPRDRQPGLRERIEDRRREGAADIFQTLLAEAGLDHSRDDIVARRNLRTRQQKQLHPYLYDKAQYQQQWKSRGLRPVHYQQIDRNERFETYEDSSSGSGGDDIDIVHSIVPDRARDAVLEDVFQIPSSPARPIPDDLIVSSATGLQLVDDDLPDLDLFVRRDGRTTYKTSKRASRSVRRLPLPADNAKHDPAFEPIALSSEDDTPRFRIPSGQAIIDPHNHVSGLPVMDSSVEFSPSTLQSTASTQGHRSTSSPPVWPDDDSDIETLHLRNQQKRIKGVLPASWLKIDMNHKTNGEIARSRTNVPISRDQASDATHHTGKGIARKVSSAKRNQSRIDRLDFSESGSQDSLGRAQIASRMSPINLAVTDFGSRASISAIDHNDDVLELDRVDPMLTAEQRVRLPNATKFKAGRSRKSRSNGHHGTSLTRSEIEGHGKGNLGVVRASAAWKPRKSSSGSTHPRWTDFVNTNFPAGHNARLPQFLKLAYRQRKIHFTLGKPVRKHGVGRRVGTAHRSQGEAVLRSRAPEGDASWAVISNSEDESSGSERPQRPSTPVKWRAAWRSSNDSTSGAILHGAAQSLIDSVAPPVPKQIGVRTKTAVLLTRPLRQAQLESLESPLFQESRAAAFERRMRDLADSLEKRHAAGSMTPVSAENLPYLSTASDQTKLSPSTLNMLPKSDKYGKSAVGFRHKRARKRSSRRDLVALAVVREDTDVPGLTAPELDAKTAHGSQDCRPIDEHHSISFGVEPIREEVGFSPDTFLGSGEFFRVLEPNSRDFSHAPGLDQHKAVPHFIERWDAWGEHVASDMGRMLRDLKISVTSTPRIGGNDVANARRADVVKIEDTLRAVVSYCSRVWFLDPLDRLHYIDAMLRLTTEIEEVEHPKQTDSGDARLSLLCLQFMVVITFHLMHISKNQIVVAEQQSAVQECFRQASVQLAGRVINSGTDDMRLSIDGTFIVDRTGKISAIVILHHCLRYARLAGSGIWDIIKDVTLRPGHTPSTMASLDQCWRKIMVVLPLLQVDAKGMISPSLDFHPCTSEAWPWLKDLLQNAFNQYSFSSLQKGAISVAYIRALLTRCYALVRQWKWLRSEVALGAMFDFFAHHAFSPLLGEKRHDSPKFLTETDRMSHLAVDSDDCAFHIFLKTLAVTLWEMRRLSVYTDKKIGAIVYRFLPNHGRVYLKDMELQRADLDALRNHFDLLSTLYVASPPNRRINVQLCQQLVDLSVSHREACRLSVECWTNLCSFQSSAEEPLEWLQPFVVWFDYMQQTFLAQYRLARTEAEHDFFAANAQGIAAISQKLLESTIRSNQHQIVANIIDLLKGLKRAVVATKHFEEFRVLIEGCSFWQIFLPLELKEKRLLTALFEALEVSNTILDLSRGLKTRSNLYQNTEESQEYGDTSALEELLGGDEMVTPTASLITNKWQEPIGQLISNLVGSEHLHDDALFTGSIDLWVRIALLKIQGGNASWNQYVQGYDRTAWTSFMDTANKHRLTCYFLSRVLASAKIDNPETRQVFIETWIASLLEREALLKYQHMLTGELLNAEWQEPLLQNSPFSKGQNSGRYEISLGELRERRLSVLSNFLGNMRYHLECMRRNHEAQAHEVKQRYAQILRAMMQVMRDNYQAQHKAGSDNENAEPQAQGAYVNFVQSVVSFMQQYTTEIFRVDPFFTDPGTFPLPVHDPEYVVGRLKSYTSRLDHGGSRKQLCVFVHSISERAAIDLQQAYLVDQLVAGMSGTMYISDTSGPTLPQMLLACIFPAYVLSYFEDRTTWIMALPMLQSSAAVIQELICAIRIGDAVSETASLEIVGVMMNCVMAVVCKTQETPEWTEAVQVSRLLLCSADMMKSCLTIVELLCERSVLGRLCRTTLHQFLEFITEIGERFEYNMDLNYDTELGGCHNFAANAIGLINQSPWSDSFAFVQKLIRDAAVQDWHVEHDRYYVRRSNVTREVRIGTTRSLEEDREILKQAFVSFKADYAAVFSRVRDY